MQLVVVPPLSVGGMRFLIVQRPNSSTCSDQSALEHADKEDAETKQQPAAEETPEEREERSGKHILS